jgi:single-strand DNA-binding protein
MARSKSNTTTATEPPKADEVAQQESITIAGRLCADPVLGQTKSGKSVTTIRVAVNPPEGDAEFHSVVVWERTAENVCKYLRKGRCVEVAGRTQERTYDGADGEQHTVTEIVARQVTFINAKRLAETVAEREVA